MSRVFQAASLLAIGVTALVAALVSVPVLAGDTIDRANEGLTILSMPASANGADPSQAPAADSLSNLVATMGHEEPADSELHCLAIGIYFESRGEPLEGQLAVAQVILNRAASGRFASTACGVLTQPSQFSFVRRGVVPAAPQPSEAWRTAVAVARIARANQWHSPAPGALFFHARHVAPGWTRPVVARLGNHVFYR